MLCVLGTALGGLPAPEGRVPALCPSAVVEVWVSPQSVTPLTIFLGVPQGIFL